MKKRGKWSDPNLNDVAAPGGKLNPDWTEWLMGWPISWTSLNPLPKDYLHEWEAKHGSKKSAEVVRIENLRAMQGRQWNSETSQERGRDRERAVEHNDTMPEVSHIDPSPGWDVGKGSSRAKEMPRMLGAVSAGKKEQGDSLREDGMLEGMGQAKCHESLGKPHQGKGMPKLREGVHLHESATSDMQPVVRESFSTENSWWESEPNVPRIASGVPNQKDRIRAIGNGQVPAVVRLAWETLSRP